MFVIVLSILTWWFWISLLGFLAFPITFILFKNLPDRGYAFTKLVGLLFTGLIAWYGGHIYYSGLTIYVAVFLLSVGSYYCYRINKSELAIFLKQNQRYLIGIELFFAGAFFSFYSCDPAIPILKAAKNSWTWPF